MDWIRSQGKKENRSITNFVVNILRTYQIKETKFDYEIRELNKKQTRKKG